MMFNNLIVDNIIVTYCILSQEYCGIVMVKKSFKSVIFWKGDILEKIK